jgi:trimeric autotransporter adhesin
MNRIVTVSRVLVSLSALLALAACGGGGGGGSSPGSGDLDPASPPAAQLTVSTFAGEGGSISPASRQVDEGSTASFTVAPDDGYGIDSVSGCGGSLSGNTFTTGPVNADCTVTASFSPDSDPGDPPPPPAAQFTVSTSAGEGGSISPEGQEVEEGETASFTVTPDAGYGIESVSGCDGSLDGTTYTTGTISGACTVTASFAMAPDAPGLTLTPQSIKIFQFTWEGVAGATGYRLFEDPDGSSGYSQVAAPDADAEAFDLEVFLPGRINARYILQACNADGCTDSADVYVTGTLAEAVGHMKAPNAGAGDAFGMSLALSAEGNTLAVGVPYEDGEEDDSGAVYVFSKTGAGWGQPAYLKAFVPEGDEWFGLSVALSADGNTLAVGAPGEGTGQANNSGAVYVFTRSGTNWEGQARVQSENATVRARFGTSVALNADGDILAVGAPRNGNPPSIPSNSGAVYVFSRSESDWTEEAFLRTSPETAGTFFGHSVALSSGGDSLAVGAPGENAGSGAAYVFSRTEEGWSADAQHLLASNTGVLDGFGTSVALSADGETLAVGAPFEGNDGLTAESGSGAAYVFTRNLGEWAEQADLKASNAGEGHGFGLSVTLSGEGDRLAVGAPFESSAAIGINGDQYNTDAGSSGAAYVFGEAEGTWSQQAYVKAPNTGALDEFGTGVVLSADGDTLAVGAPFEANNGLTAESGSGAAYLY